VIFWLSIVNVAEPHPASTTVASSAKEASHAEVQRLAMEDVFQPGIVSHIGHDVPERVDSPTAWMP
jgi:hypothetical protein